MVVQGQPKAAAEYIQATSRVGREADPGLVITMLNVHKPRDRTHYEQFRAFHMSFYRAVEATSVTPFAARALDGALAATLVAAARHVEPDLTPRSAPDLIASNGHAYGAVRGGGLSEDAHQPSGCGRDPARVVSTRRASGCLGRNRRYPDSQRGGLRLCQDEPRFDG